MAKPLTLWQRFWNWTAPGLSESDAEKTLAARTLHAVLLGVLIWVVFYFAVGLPFFVARKFAATALAVLLASAAVTSLFYLRQGRVRLGSWIFLTATWIINSILTLLSGGFSSPALACFLALTVMATWLLGQRIALTLGGILLATALALAILMKASYHLPTYFPAPPMAGWIVLSFAVALTVLPLNRVLRIIRDSLEHTQQKVARLKQAEEALRESESLQRQVFTSLPAGVIIVDPVTRVIERVNDHVAILFGAPADHLVGRRCHSFLCPADEGACPVCDLGQNVDNSDRIMLRNDGSRLPILKTVKRIQLNGEEKLLECFVDISDRKRAEEEKATLAVQLQQAQKMESVGRLAGGVAHDFNNMLGVILGYTEFALEQVDPAQPLHVDLREVQKAAKRSADLTRQLLAFARKQTVEPRVLDLNETIDGMLKMLERMIGEGILLNWQPSANLWPVLMDPSQIDQILANLCVNARDAIADVGRITLETGNCTVDEEYCAAHVGFVPGEYVQLTVSDDGRGMDRETLSHIFEPFFTTKRVGMGTGLGLATVYGAVKQNNGFINVYSEPGLGTTINIYLPRHEVKDLRSRSEDAVTARQGQETILLVEDEPAILKLATTMLQRHGYTVLAASAPGEAVRLAREHSGKIHLLLTDVIMPEMNGHSLAKHLQSLYPNLKCLFMSGYTADVIAHHGVLEAGVCFIQKPFSAQSLAKNVIEALE